MNWTEEELAQMLKDNPELRIGGALPATLASTEEEVSKYRSRRTEYGGILYDSKKEAEKAQELDLRVAGKAVLYWLRQVPFRLPGGVVYRVDFQVFYPNREVRYFDCKGRDRKTGKFVTDTAASRLKRRQVEALYPVSIELI